MRLLRSMSLLRDPDAKVINVAEQSGFNHLGLFNICFKRRFGMNPSQCRKQSEEAGSWLGELQGNNNCALRAAGLCAWRSETRPTAAKAKRGGRSAPIPSASKLVPSGIFSQVIASPAQNCLLQAAVRYSTLGA
jgi:hypothetical protein